MIYTFDQLVKKVNQEIDGISFDRSPQKLYEPAKYALSLGGKRIRPILALMGCNLFADSVDLAIYPAIGLEIFHNFTLLHDDVMDNASIRRGQSTVHVKWSPNTAILSGDALQIISYQYISQCPEKQLPAILSLFSKTAMQVCEGQQFDMDFEQRMNVKEEEYIEMIRLKTAVLLACSLKIGALLGGASDADSNLMYDCGEKLGLAFQLRDDLLDTFGDEGKFGKAIGGDIVSNKKTYLLIKAMELATISERSEITEWLVKKEFVRQDKIDVFTKLYYNKGIRGLCEQKINKYFQEAMDALLAVDIDALRKVELISLSTKLMHRES